jgi:hypothetical protein
MAPRLNIILPASISAVAVTAVAGLYVIGYRRGLELGQRIRRVDPRPDDPAGEEVVVPMRRRA